jgi:hypothetical protein
MTKKATTGLYVTLLLLLSLGILPFVSLAVIDVPGPEARRVAWSLIPATVGFVVTAGLALLLFFLRKMWVVLLIVLRSIAGIVLSLTNMFRFREMTGEWGWHPEIWVFMLVAAAFNLAVIVAVLTPSTQRSLRSDFTEDEDD